MRRLPMRLTARQNINMDCDKHGNCSDADSPSSLHAKTLRLYQSSEKGPKQSHNPGLSVAVPGGNPTLEPTEQADMPYHNLTSTLSFLLPPGS
jgi:hypothetical protein